MGAHVDDAAAPGGERPGLGRYDDVHRHQRTASDLRGRRRTSGASGRFGVGSASGSRPSPWWCGTAPTRWANHSRARSLSSRTSLTRLPVSLAPRSTRRHQLTSSAEPGAPVVAPRHPERDDGHAQGPGHEAAGDLGEGGPVPRDVRVVPGDDIGHVLQRLGARLEVARVRRHRRMVRRVRAHPGAAELRRGRGRPEDAELGDGVARRLLGRRSATARGGAGAGRRPSCPGCPATTTSVTTSPASAKAAPVTIDPKLWAITVSVCCGLQGQRGDELGQVVGGRRQVVGALDRPRRRGQDVGRVVVALPQARRRSRRSPRRGCAASGIQSSHRFDPSPTPGTNTATCSAVSRSPKRSA